jgi:acyl carrier protein
MLNQRFYVLDSALNPVPVGVTGGLYIGGIGLAKGYWRDEERTKASFIDHPVTGEKLYRTGDLGRYFDDGNIEFLGRIDTQVKIRGFRIELGEIEAAISALPNVRDYVVVVREDVPGDKRLVAYFVREEGSPEADTAAFRQSLQQSLPDYMVPAHFIEIERLPLTPNGKIDRKALPAPDAARNASGYVAPRTSTEEALAQMWAEVLQLDKVGIHDNFFELGGSSLLIVRLHTQLTARFGNKISVVDLFRYPTIDRVSQFLGEDAPEAAHLPDSAARGGARRNRSLANQKRLAARGPR